MENLKTEYYSNGKLLISGEYAVLDGATGLAFPTKYGQSLCIENFPEPVLLWRSFDHKNKIWFQGEFSLTDFSTSRESPVTRRLTQILRAARKLNPSFLKKEKGFLVETYLDFPKNWGLGTSSTLINNIAQWAEINPFQLLDLTFGGSGYDIAAAQNNGPILFSRKNSKMIIKPVKIDWKFQENLFFVYLNRKKNSRDAIKEYKRKPLNTSSLERVSQISEELTICHNLQEFEVLLNDHEEILSSILGKRKIKDVLFPDYPRVVKSLGGWGGDFVLVTGDQEEYQFFREKNYKVIIPFKDMIL